MSKDAPRSSDEELLRLFLLGERNACDRVERWARDLIFFRGAGLREEDQRDAVQDTLRDLWNLVSAEGFELQRNLKSLVRTIAAARMIDRLRKYRPSTEEVESLPDPQRSPYERLFRKERTARVRWALQQVSERCRELIQRHFFEGASYVHIAAEGETQASTLRVHMFHCMKSLRRLIDRQEYGS